MRGLKCPKMLQLYAKYSQIGRLCHGLSGRTKTSASASSGGWGTLRSSCGCGGGINQRTIMTSAVAWKGQEAMGPGPEVNILEYIETVQQTGKVAVLFSDSPPVLGMVDVLCAFKDFAGISWIGTILCGTILIRTFVGLPIAVVQQKAIGRLENLKPELEKMVNQLKWETAQAIKELKWDEKTTKRQFTKSYKKHWRRMVEENNCHPMRSVALSLIQFPFWICFSSALRNIVYAVPLPRTTERIDRWIQIHNESMPWVSSLVLPDPIVFPTIFLISNFLNIEYSRRQRLQNVPETKAQKVVPWVFRGVIVAVAILATSVPSAVSMYWAASSSLAFAQNIFLRSETAKRIFKLATVSSHPNPKVSSIKQAVNSKSKAL